MARATSTARWRANRDRITPLPPWFIERADPRPRVLRLREPQRAARVRQQVLRLERRVAHVPHSDVARAERRTARQARAPPRPPPRARGPRGRRRRPAPPPPPAGRRRPPP